MSPTLDGKAIYEVRVQGRLDASWSDWLNDVTVTSTDGPDGPTITVLTGQFDQAALRGLLTRLWDLNLKVVSVTVLDGSLRRPGAALTV